MAVTDSLLSSDDYRLFLVDTHKTYNNLAAIKADAIDANEFVDATLLSGIGETANTDSVPIYGKKARKRLSGTPDLEDITVEVLYDQSNTLHAHISPAGDWEVGREVTFLTHFKVGTKEQAIAVQCTIGARRWLTPAGETLRAEITLAPESTPVLKTA